jgi:predicted transcriptional regulator
MAEKNEPRNRLALTVSDDLDEALERLADTFGCPKTVIAVQLITESLPAMVRRAEDYKQAVYLAKKPIGKR